MNNKEALKQLETELKLKGFSSNTLNTYRFFIEKFLGDLNKKPSDITKNDIKNFLASHMDHYSNKTNALIASALNFFSKFVLNINFSLPAPKVEKKLPIALTKEEMKSLIYNSGSYKSKLIILLLYSSGLRVSELVNLKRFDLDFSEKIGWVRKGKGSKDRAFQISDKIAEELRSYFKKTSDFIYVFSKEKPLSTRNIQKIVKTAAKHAGINKKVTPHTLRHSYATHLLDAGTDIRYIQTLLGHENLNTTQIYTHVSTKALKKIKNPLDEL